MTKNAAASRAPAQAAKYGKSRLDVQAMNKGRRTIHQSSSENTNGESQHLETSSCHAHRGMPSMPTKTTALPPKRSHPSQGARSQSPPSAHATAPCPSRRARSQSHPSQGARSQPRSHPARMNLGWVRAAARSRTLELVARRSSPLPSCTTATPAEHPPTGHLASPRPQEPLPLHA
jgi:hypothetical protein